MSRLTPDNGSGQSRSVPSLGFRQRFAGAILCGEKRQTIRKPRKKPLQVGDRLHLFTGMRTKSCRKLGVASCTALQDIRIEKGGFTLDRVRSETPGQLAEMARADGFASWPEMVDFFQKTHGLPFAGVLVRWGPLEPAGKRTPPRSLSTRPRASISPMDPNAIRSTMNGKPVLWRKAKTVLNLEAEEFQHKRLCDGITLNLGDACAYGCAFCYVEGQVTKLTHATREAYTAQTGRGSRPKHSEVVMRRTNALGLLRQQLFDKKGQPKFTDPSDTRVVFTSTLVDVAANRDLLRESAEAIKMIMDATHWQVRVLSKSDRLPDLVDLIPDQYRRRLIMGVSTGTPDDKLAKAIEIGTPLVSRRIKSLHEMQDNRIRTFGMICPSLPQKDYDRFSREICDAIRADRCEHVWAEVMNVRGESFARTQKALEAAGFLKEAADLVKVSGPGNGRQWEEYARATFLAHAKNVPPGKLRFLQYVKAGMIEWWKQREPQGAVLLGKIVHPKKKKKALPALTAAQTKMRRDLETRVTRGVKATFEMWLALHKIRTYEDGLLFRSRGFGTFQAYCFDRWGYAKAHAHRLASCGGFIETLQAFKSPNGDSLPLPRSEGQIRPIIALPEDRQIEAWAHALEVAPPEQLTGQVVAARVREFSEENVPKALSPRARAMRALKALRAAVTGVPKAEEIGRRLDGIEGLI